MQLLGVQKRYFGIVKREFGTSYSDFGLLGGILGISRESMKQFVANYALTDRAVFLVLAIEHLSLVKARNPQTWCDFENSRHFLKHFESVYALTYVSDHNHPP